MSRKRPRRADRGAAKTAASEAMVRGTVAALKVSLKLCAEQDKALAGEINKAMRLMDKYRVPSNGEGGTGKREEFSLVQRTALLLKHLTRLEVHLLDLKQDNEALEEELDDLEFEFSSVTGHYPDDDVSDVGEDIARKNAREIESLSEKKEGD